MSAHYWGIGWLAWVQNSRSLLLVHDPYARFGWARIPQGFRPKGLMSMSFCLLINAVVIHICLVPPAVSLSTPSTLQVSSLLHTPQSHAPTIAWPFCPVATTKHVCFLFLFLTFVTTLMPQSLQPQAHTALRTSNETP